MGLGTVVGAAITAAGIGASALAARRQRKQAEEAQQQALSRQNAESQIVGAQIEQQRQMARLQQEAASQQLEQRRQAIKSSLDRPAASGGGALRGLATIATSPLGDTSEPSLGRSKLLGN